MNKRIEGQSDQVKLKSSIKKKVGVTWNMITGNNKEVQTMVLSDDINFKICSFEK